MIYGIVADMHGNLEALQATLRALDDRGVDRIVCLGDVVGYNAESNECADLLRTRRIDTIAGNHDLIAIRRLGLGRCADRPAFTLRRTRKDLTAASRAYLATLPARLSIEDDVVLVHGGVNDVQEYVTTTAQVRANSERLAREVPAATVCFFGHTHEPKAYELHEGSVVERPATGRLTLRSAGYSYFINPGSVDGSRKPTPRFAEFVIFDASARTVEFMTVPYNYESVEQSAMRRGYRMGPSDVTVYRARRVYVRIRNGVARRIARIFPRLVRSPD